jgi:AcrR family transcriptional regulator
MGVIMMVENPKLRPDRRLNRTRRLLRESLMSHILEKGYDAVTIEDITSRADLGRTTFYLHYRDKEHLFMESIEQIADELAEQIYRTPLNVLTGESGGPGQNTTLPIFLVFRHAAKNADLYRAILRSEGSIKATIRLRELAAGYALDFMQMIIDSASPRLKPALPLDVMGNYFASSLLGMLIWWLEAGMPYPPDEMGELFRRLVMEGMRSAVQGV